MRIIAIDTATAAACAAIAAVKDGKAGLLGHFTLTVGLTHSQRFLPLTEALLASCDLRLQDMDAISVTIGPGSFTGLRIGMATAKAWAQALSLPVIAVKTTDALAWANSWEGLTCPLLDARKGEVYCALYHRSEEIWPTQAMPPADLAVRLAKLGEDIRLCGDGAEIYLPQIAELLGDKVSLAPPTSRFAAAQSAALYGLEVLQRGGQTVSAQDLEPFYLRSSSAEVKKK